EVAMDASSRRFFQYVADDSTQLHSNVIRVFRETYDAASEVDLARITSGTIDFHVHVLLPIGVKEKSWKKIGHAPPPAKLDIIFRSSEDYGDPTVKISKKWYVWNVNGPHETVGELRPKYQSAEIG